VNEYSSYFFVPVSLRLVNEEAPTCKKMAAATLVALMKRVSDGGREGVELFGKASMGSEQ